MNADRAAALGVRGFPIALIVLAIASPAITWNTPYFQLIASWAVLAIVVALTLMAGRPSAGRLPSGMSTAGFAAWVLALDAGILLLLVPVIILATKTAADTTPGWTYPFLNKRWLVALYGVGVVTFLLLPAVFRSLMPLAPARDAAIVERPWSRWMWLWTAAAAVVVVAFVWFAAGPPWNADRHHRAIDFHEQVHLGPLQAISKGHTPFIGPASTQYGPGSQLLTYFYMTRIGGFTIAGYREANLAIHFTSLLAVGLLALWLIDLPSALLVIVLALAFSPLSFFVPAGDGTFAGGYGWANAFRYLGCLIVVPLATLSAPRAASGRVWRHAACGVVWGLFAWISQENLTSTAAAAGFVLMVMALTRTIPLMHLWRIGVSMIAGFLLFWVPLLIVYAISGDAIEFLGNYFRVARAVALGFSNSWWSESTDSPVYTAFRMTPYVIAATGIATLWDLRTLEIRSPLEPRQVRLLAFVAMLTACYATALYRSDNSHLINTLIALPFVLTLAFRDLPSWSGNTWMTRLAVRAAVVVMAFYAYPISPMLTDMYGGLIRPSLVRFAGPPPPSAAIDDHRTPFLRAGRYLSDEPLVAAGSVPMRRFLDEISAVRDLVGTRKTYLAGMGSVYTGLVYFMGDLTPARVLMERETMMINSLYSQALLSDVRRRMPEIECIMVREREMDEAKAFLEAHPDAIVEQRPLAGAPVFILMIPKP